MICSIALFDSPRTRLLGSKSRLPSFDLAPYIHYTQYTQFRSFPHNHFSYTHVPIRVTKWVAAVAPISYICETIVKGICYNHMRVGGRGCYIKVICQQFTNFIWRSETCITLEGSLKFQFTLHFI